MIVLIALRTAWASPAWIKAQSIRIGDSKSEVERRLGRATAVMSFSTLWRTNALAALFSDTAETWVYGSQFELKNSFQSECPFFWPFRMRFLLPDQDDVAIEFNTAGKVVRIVIPPEKL